MESKNMPGSRMTFVDRRNSTEATSIFIDGEKIATVIKKYDKNLKRTVYRSFGLERREIFPPNANLDQVKEQFKKAEVALCEAIDIRELAKSMEFENLYGAEPFKQKRAKKLHAIRKGKSKSRTR